jgi:hypothetical protein
MKKSTIALLAIGGTGLAVVTLVGVVAALLFLGATGLSSRAPTADEKELLVPIERLATIGAEVRVSETAATYTAKRNLDLSLEIEYEYDSDKDPDSTDFLFFKSEAEISRSERDAWESFWLAIQATRLGVSLVKERSLEPSEASLELGDQAYWAIVHQAGAPVGNFVAVRQGRIVHTLLVLGLYFDEPGQAETLLAPAIEKSSAWK